MSSQTVNIFADHRFTWMWTESTHIPAWKFTTPNRNKASRRQRIFPNAVNAYHAMLHGGHGVESVAVRAYGVDDVDFDHKRFDWGRDEAFGAKESMKHIVQSMYTPYFSSPCVNWSATANTVEDSHLYVDASICMDGPQGLPVSCFALYSQSSGLEVHDLEANGSVDAEYQGIQSALRVAYRMAKDSGQRVTVFADCAPAITRSIFNREKDQCPYLGSEVFIQWLPGHQGYEGMTVVDRAARERVRELMGA